MDTQGALAIGSYCLICFHVSSFIYAQLMNDLIAYLADRRPRYLVVLGNLSLAFWLAIDHCKVALGPNGRGSVMAILKRVQQANCRLVSERT